MGKDLLAAHLRDRPAELKKASNKGTKIIGYFPGNYVPEEIIYASGAIPLCLTHGGNPQPAEEGLSILPHLICPFARAQVGERLLKQNPYYTAIDMLIAPITCQHLKKVAEIWEYHNEIKIFKLGVPHQHSHDFEIAYYTGRLRALRDRLQDYTGNKITDERLCEAIDLYNRMRKLFREISLQRKTSPSSISTLNFVKLNHASFYADPVYMVDQLALIRNELKAKQPAESEAPRILLLGPNLSNGDYRVLELVAEAGGEIVIEEICEGIRYYWNEIDNTGDLLESLTRGYLIDRLPCAYMRFATGKRLDFTLKLIEEYNISGVIWYELLCCETYDSEAYFFATKLAEKDIPFLILESDYGTAGTGQLKIRVEAFIEILKGVME